MLAIDAECLGASRRLGDVAIAEPREDHRVERRRRHERLDSAGVELG